MFQTTLIYLFLVIFMTFLVAPNTRLNIRPLGNITRPYDMSFFIALLLFAVIFGMRYNVGVDYDGYKSAYIWEQQGKYWVLDVYKSKGEYLFYYISKLLADLKFHYWIYFFVLAFIQVSFVFYAIKRNNPEVLLFLPITFIFSGTALSFMNLIRQQIAFSIFLFSIEYIDTKKPIKHYLLFVVAYLFHQSAIILFPFYFLLRYFQKVKLFESVKSQVILMIISIIVLLLFNPALRLYNFLSNFFETFGYQGYIQKIQEKQDLLFSLKRPRGIGFILNIIQNFIFISYSNKVKQYYSSTYLNKMYILYFIGVIFGYLANGSIILTRPNVFFLGFSFVIGAYTLAYLFKTLREKSNNLIGFIILFSVYILTLAAIIYRQDENSYRFVFFWQEHLFPLKEQFNSIVTP